MNPTNMRCPDCGSGRRSDGYHREGWYWLECDRRYNPDLDEYSPENNWCRLKRLEAKFEELHTACLEYLKAPPTNVPARRKFAEIVTGGSCDHLDDDVVTDQHECDWEFVVPHYKGAEKVFIVCRHTHCKMVLTKKMAVDMLNEYETQNNTNDDLLDALEGMLGIIDMLAEDGTQVSAPIALKILERRLQATEAIRKAKEG